MKKHRRTQKNAERIRVFEVMHPWICVSYFMIVLLLSMLAIHPIYPLISFVAALALSIYLGGWHVSFKMLTWQFPLIALIACINPIFSKSGTTVLVEFGPSAITLEELMFGAAMGFMLVSIMLWFVNLSWIVPSDKLLSLFGGRAPRLSFMLSTMMRYIPHYIKRGKEIDQVTQACSAARVQTQSLRGRVRLISVLMAWNMEESLEMADAMKARGWGVSRKRSKYMPYHLKKHDIFVLSMLGVLGCICLTLLCLELASFHFYPTMSSLVFQPGYCVFIGLTFLPFCLIAFDYLRWRHVIYD